MQEYLTNTSELKSLADEIRKKAKLSTPLLYPDGFISAISTISLDPVYETGHVTPLEEAVVIVPSYGYDAFSVVYVEGISSNYVGTAIPLRSANDVIISASSATVASGYYSSTCTVMIPFGSAYTPSTTFNVIPTIAIDSADGNINVAFNSSKTITPIVTAGYISSVDIRSFAISGTSTYQLPVQGTKTITPTESTQLAISAFTYLTGTVTLNAVSSTYIGPSVSTLSACIYMPSSTSQYISSAYYLTGDQTILGDSNLVASNIKKGVALFGVYGTYEGDGEPTSEEWEDGVLQGKYVSSMGFSDYYENTRVSIVGSCLFMRHTSLLSVSFPACKIIGNHAFNYCTSLSYVYAPQCERIESYAFYFCSRLSSINFPECKYIGDSAFYSAKKGYTEGLSFPKCSYVGLGAFQSCPAPTIYFPSCLYIGSYAFYTNFYLSSLDLPMTEYIGDYAFASCTSMSQVDIPNCSFISNYAFTNCSHIISVSAPLCEYLGKGAFQGCTLIENIFFPLCSYVEALAFNYCLYVSNINLPLAETIESQCFMNIGKSTSEGTDVYLSNCLFLGSSAFSSAKIKSLSLPKCISIESYCFYYTNISFLSIPVCETLKDSCFYSNSFITSIYAPECKIIGSQCFRSCYNLSSVYIPKCEIINYYAFGSCSSLYEISCPVCSIIGDYAFYYDSNLRNVYFPEVKSIGVSAFAGCSALESISINKCEYIDYSAFRYCGIKEISLLNCSEIQERAFERCSYLTTVTLSDCKIHASAFVSCYRLLSLYLLGSSIVSLAATYYSNPFTSTPVSTYTSYTDGQRATIYVLSSMLSAYQTATQWISFSSIMSGI